MNGYACNGGLSSVSSYNFENMPGSKEEKLNVAALIQGNKAKTYAALDKIPFSEESPYKKSITAWLDQYFAASEKYLTDNGMLGKVIKVEPDKAPALWFQMSCEEQQKFLDKMEDEVIPSSKVSEDQIKQVPEKKASLKKPVNKPAVKSKTVK